MTDTTLNPAYLLRSYAWKVLKTNMADPWSEGNYGGLIPIVPVAEEPDLSQYSGPHIVYGYALDGTGMMWERKTGSMTFAVYDQNFRRLTKTMNILHHALSRQDQSAEDVNNYTSRLKSDGSLIPLVNGQWTANAANPFIGIRFGYISAGFLEGGSPEETEGGRQSALLNVRFEYYDDPIVTTVFSS